MNEALTHAEVVLRAACGPRLRTAVSMAPLTTFRIGGPAALYLEPDTDADLEAVSAAVARTSIPVVVLGKGSNVLVAEKGFPGLVLRLGRGYRWAARDGDVLSSGGAMPLPALSGVALRHHLAGSEFGVAIPATLGGAVTMNAGAHGRSMSDVLSSIEVFRLEEGRTGSIAAADAGFSYRRSALGVDAVVVGASLSLEAGEPAEIRTLMDEARAWRRATQPLAEPNCGSVFTNPPNDHAARLIEAAGLKGVRMGGVAVSAKHANFIVAEAGASADDAHRLIAHIQETVLERSGVRLEPEVRLIGAFDDVSL